MSKNTTVTAFNRLLERLEEENHDLSCTLLGAILAMVTIGRFDVLEKIFLQALGRGLDPVMVYEILLQSHLFAGFPRAINGLQIFQDTLKRTDRNPGDYTTEGKAESGPDRRKTGMTLFRAVYGENSELVLNTLHSLYPQYDRWILEDAYGRVLSRPILSGKIRELCAVAALTASDVPRQLKSHIMGALNLGATPADVRSAIVHMEPLLGRKKIDAALAIMAGLHLK